MPQKYMQKTDPAVELLRETVINLTKDNFLLWMYIAQEGYLEDAFDFVKTQRTNPTPFTTFMNLGLLQQQLWAENNVTEVSQ